MIFFDIGSTLIDGPSIGPARRLAEALALGQPAVKKLEHLLFRTPSDNPEVLAARMAENLGVDRDAAIQACSDLWLAQLREAYVLPGALDAVRELAAAGLPRAYLSNIWPPFYEHFRREFAEEMANPQFLSFRTGLMKPDPEFFLHALRETGVRPEQATMVGDTYLNDILPAIELGMRTVWILHRPEKERTALVGVLNGQLPSPNLTLASIGELNSCKLSNINSSARPNFSAA